MTYDIELFDSRRGHDYSAGYDSRGVIATARDCLRDEPGRRLDIARQQAWLLWTGRHLPSYEILQRLAAMAIESQDLAKLERAKPPTNGRRRKGHPGTRSTGEEGEDRS
jgi:hypothetical protein